MKILFDGQIFSLQKFGGISRYFTELIAGINQYSRHLAVCAIADSQNIHYIEKIGHKASFGDLLRFVLQLRFTKKKRERYYARKNKSGIIKDLRAQKFDVFVPTYYDPSFLSHLGNKPFVLNVYDMIHEIFPANFPPDDMIAINKAELLNKATKIIAISQSTKKDILKFHPNIDESKIEVVYLSHSLTNNRILDLNLPTNYILFVGNRAGYKNFDFFFRAASSILEANPSLFLVCAGGNAFNQEELEMIESYGLSERVIQNNFKDFELATYYTNAKCFVFPSAYEGFGIPVLESMSCGCPVVLARHSSFPEVAGEAGVYFELNDEKDLKKQLSLLLDNEELRLDYSRKGIDQANKFSWQKTTADCITVFESILKN